MVIRSFNAKIWYVVFSNDAEDDYGGLSTVVLLKKNIVLPVPLAFPMAVVYIGFPDRSALTYLTTQSDSSLGKKIPFFTNCQSALFSFQHLPSSPPPPPKIHTLPLYIT